METLADTTWDVVLAGTGLPQSLLALALSRSKKRILHIDRNDYYGGLNAALSLQDAQKLVETVNSGNHPYSNAYISTLYKHAEGCTGHDHHRDTQLAFSGAYSLCLSPQIIYTRSHLLTRLVASKSYRQLEFLAVGSWWLYENLSTMYTPRDAAFESAKSRIDNISGRLIKIPGSKEDVFNDDTIDRRTKRALTNFLRLATQMEDNRDLLEEWGAQPFEDFLTNRCELTPILRAAIHALTLMPTSARNTKTSEAMQRISRHLSSVGVLGSGFNAVLPKWGGLGEIAQVACRASAVGGGVYALEKKIQNVDGECKNLGTHDPGDKQDPQLMTISLDDGSKIKSTWLVGCRGNIPQQAAQVTEVGEQLSQHNISIASSSLSKMILSSHEEATASAVAVITFPSGSIPIDLYHDMELPPVYITLHSSDTGECPSGQCVLYTTVWAPSVLGKALIAGALRRLLSASGESVDTGLLWSLSYTSCSSLQHKSTEQITLESHTGKDKVGQILTLPEIQPDISFDDNVLEHVKHAWTTITGKTDGFLKFDDIEA